MTSIFGILALEMYFVKDVIKHGKTKRIAAGLQIPRSQFKSGFNFEANMEKLQMYEILVPTMHNNGKPVRARFHRVWDAKVRAISGGLTIFPPTKGQWISPKKELIYERMIPVRIAASRPQIEMIILMTMDYYKQEVVLCYAIAETVLVGSTHPNGYKYVTEQFPS